MLLLYGMMGRGCKINLVRDKLNGIPVESIERKEGRYGGVNERVV